MLVFCLLLHKCKVKNVIYNEEQLEVWKIEVWWCFYKYINYSYNMHTGASYLNFKSVFSQFSSFFVSVGNHKLNILIQKSFWLFNGTVAQFFFFNFSMMSKIFGFPGFFGEIVFLSFVTLSTWNCFGIKASIISFVIGIEMKTEKLMLTFLIGMSTRVKLFRYLNLPYVHFSFQEMLR